MDHRVITNKLASPPTRLAITLLVFGVLAFASQVEANETQAPGCTPSFIEISPSEPIRAEVGSWEILFKVALIGCLEDLRAVTQEEIESLKREFISPEECSNLLLVTEETLRELRKRALQTTNRNLGRQIATDILFHDIAILDHNSQ